MKTNTIQSTIKELISRSEVIPKTTLVTIYQHPDRTSYRIALYSPDNLAIGIQRYGPNGPFMSFEHVWIEVSHLQLHSLWSKPWTSDEAQSLLERLERAYVDEALTRALEDIVLAPDEEANERA